MWTEKLGNERENPYLLSKFTTNVSRPPPDVEPWQKWHAGLPYVLVPFRIARPFWVDTYLEMVYHPFGGGLRAQPDRTVRLTGEGDPNTCHVRYLNIFF